MCNNNNNKFDLYSAFLGLRVACNGVLCWNKCSVENGVEKSLIRGTPNALSTNRWSFGAIQRLVSDDGPLCYPHGGPFWEWPNP